jgi:hypothetical protein
VIDQRQEGEVAGRTTARGNGRNVRAVQEDGRDPSTDQRESATGLFRLVP